MIETILMPTDGSATAKRACGVAAELAKRIGASVVVLGVVHPQQWGDAAAYVDFDTLRAEVKAAVDEQVGQFQAEGVATSGMTMEGGPVHELIQRAADEKGAGLIVMGTHGHGGLSRVLIGSVADRVVRHSSVPVLVVPPAS